MTAAKVYLDEDVHSLIADALRLRGWDVLTTIEADRQGSTDEQQMEYATENGFVILSYNVADFPRLHDKTLAAGGHHAGMIVATQENPSRNAKTLLALIGTFDAEDFIDELIYLNNWM
jgi:hypothetical protein